VSLLTAENAGSAFGKGNLSFVNLAGLDIKRSGRLGYRLFTF